MCIKQPATKMFRSVQPARMAAIDIDFTSRPNWAGALRLLTSSRE